MITSLFCEDGDKKKLCVRRFAGIVGFLVCVIALFVPSINNDCFTPLLYASTGLLGLTTADKFTKKKEEDSCG